MSTTPRTDAEFTTYGIAMPPRGCFVNADFARTLEIELYAFKRSNERILWDYNQRIGDIKAAECERLKAMGSWAHTCVHHTDADRKAGVSCPCCASAELARLRAEVEKLTIADHAWRTAAKFDAHNADVLNAQITSLRAENERLKNQRDNLLKPSREKAIDRAERAEAELAAARKEIEVLRWWGNKDCTAMADAALKGIIP